MLLEAIGWATWLVWLANLASDILFLLFTLELRAYDQSSVYRDIYSKDTICDPKRICRRMPNISGDIFLILQSTVLKLAQLCIYEVRTLSRLFQARLTRVSCTLFPCEN